MRKKNHIKTIKLPETCNKFRSRDDETVFQVKILETEHHHTGEKKKVLIVDMITAYKILRAIGNVYMKVIFNVIFSRTEDLEFKAENLHTKDSVSERA